MGYLSNFLWIFCFVYLLSLKIHVLCDDLPFYIDYPLTDDEVPPTLSGESIPINQYHGNPSEVRAHYDFPPLFTFPYHVLPKVGLPQERRTVLNEGYDEDTAYRINPSRVLSRSEQRPNKSPLGQPVDTREDAQELPYYGAARVRMPTIDVSEPATDHKRGGEKERNASGVKHGSMLDILRPTRFDSGSDESDEDESGERQCPSKSKVGGGQEEANKTKGTKGSGPPSSDTKRPLRRRKSNHCRCGIPQTQRIINGIPTKIHKHPWMILQVYASSNSPYCGGTLINDQYILTAAHCLDGMKPEKMYITLGHTSSSNPGINVTADKFIQHEKYNKYTFEQYDIALIKLKLPLSFNEYFVPRTICIPENDRTNYNNKKGIITGWGVHDHSSKLSDVLLEANVTVLYHKKCKIDSKYDPKDLNDNIICAKGKNIDSCQGDSGGPLIVKKRGKIAYQIGVVSWGIGCALDDYPGVYTKVDRFSNWITKNTEGAVYCTDPSRGYSGEGFRRQVPVDRTSEE